MADAKDSGSNLPTSGIVLLLFMATGTIFFTRDLPLQGSRPPSAERQIHETNAAKAVEARLWQDPLAAVRKSWADEKKGEEKKREHSAGSTELDCNSSHRVQCRSLVGPLDRVVGVTIPGAPYAEDAESRRRDRYAVLAALYEQKYVPEDGEHIDYFVPSDEKDVVLPETVPFEWFNPAEPGSKHPEIMILWINEDALTRGPRPTPLASLASLYRQLKFPEGPQRTRVVADSAGDAAGIAGSTQSPDAPPSSNNTTSRGLTIIGPNSSRTLIAMIEEVRRTPRLCADSKLSVSCPIEFFDYGATASNEDAVPERKNAEDYFRDNGIVFHRMVAPDDVLARALAQELRLRDICLTEKDCHRWPGLPGRVAMVSEWDTFYGRSLRATISRELCQPNSAPDCSSKFEQYSYLRGLDGQLPNDGSSVEVKSAETEKSSREPASNNKKDDDSSNDTAKRLEHPDGLGQFDYLRRLAATMKRRHQELRRHGESGITAIGVLGTDVYDKLLVLRALRPEFPEALFFTTDLDARFSDQGEIAATRNLLVVSAFDVQLRPEIQKDIPPFRDGYQTAAFLSTQAAISSGDGDCGNCIMPTEKSARIFQIGRSGAFAFPAASKAMAGDPSDAECRRYVLRCANIHAASSLYPKMYAGSLPRMGAAFLSGLLLAGASLGCLAFVGGFNQATTRANRTLISPAVLRRIIAVAGFVVGAALGAYWNDVAEWLTGYGTGEPMRLSEGISVWPIIAMRALSFAVCVVLILYSLNRLDANIDTIARELRIDDLREAIITEQQDADRHRFLWARLRDAFSLRLQERPPHGHEMDEPYEIVKFWRTYVYRGRPWARICRVTFCVVVMFIFGSVLSLVFGAPNDPARDLATHRLNMATTTLDVFATQFLIFLVADATLFSCLFVHELRKVRSVWPERSRKAFRALLGVDGAPVDEWIDTQFVAMRTQCIINLIYLPFLMIALLIVSRSSAFDSFAASSTLILMHGLSLAVLGGCILWLRWEAEQVRQTARSNLTSALISMKSDECPLKVSGRSQPAEELEKLIGRVEALDAGAFATITRQPVVRALLLPLGTYGGTALLEHFSLGGF